MPRRALHLAEYCLKVPGDASRTAENGSRPGLGSLAAAQSMPGFSRSVMIRRHHGHRGSIGLAQESSGVAACQQREDTTPSAIPTCRRRSACPAGLVTLLGYQHVQQAGDLFEARSRAVQLSAHLGESGAHLGLQIG